MQGIDLSRPGERKKLVSAIGLGAIALVFLWWTFFGFGSSSSTPIRNTANPAGSAASNSRVVQTADQTAEDLRSDVLNMQPVTYVRNSPPASEGGRNIFAYYEPPKPQPQLSVPTPTPTPTPPVLLASVSPSNVYARTGEFTLEATGDKFTPDLRLLIDGREVPTRFVGPQQVSATIPATLIATAGARQVALSSLDGRIYSNPMVLNVSQPPTPNYTYVGIIGTVRHVDTAILQDRNSREIMNVQRGDVLGGRFRITSISEKELVLVDTNLRIRHTLPLTIESDRGFNPLQRPTPKVESEDDEP